MYFNRKNAEQKNWRMIKKGKHFLFGCSLVFAVGAALVAPTVKADTAGNGEVENKTTSSAAEASPSDEVGTYKAPAVEVSTTSPVVAEKTTSSEATSAKTAKEADVVEAKAKAAEVVETKAKEAEGVQLPTLTVVADATALTEKEKANVVAAVKAANPTATDVQVQADGSVVVTFADGSSANLSASQTVKVAPKTDKLKLELDNLTTAIQALPEHETTVDVREKANAILASGLALLEAPDVTVQDVEDMTKTVKRSYVSVMNATTRLASGRRDPRNGQKMPEGVQFRDGVAYSGDEAANENGKKNDYITSNVGKSSTSDDAQNAGSRVMTYKTRMNKDQNGKITSIDWMVYFNNYAENMDIKYGITGKSSRNYAQIPKEVNMPDSIKRLHYKSVQKLQNRKLVKIDSSGNPLSNEVTFDNPSPREASGFPLEKEDSFTSDSWKSSSRGYDTLYNNTGFYFNGADTDNPETKALVEANALPGNRVVWDQSNTGSDWQDAYVWKFTTTVPEETTNEQLKNMKLVMGMVRTGKASYRPSFSVIGNNPVDVTNADVAKPQPETPQPGVNNTYTQTNGTITVPTVASTDETLTGTGQPGAIINIKKNGKTARQIKVAENGQWSFPLDLGLNSNVTGGGQLVPADKISVSQTVNGVESADTDVNVSLGHSEIVPSSKSKQQNNLVENDRNVTLKVPHDAGAAYFQFTDADGNTQEVGLKRDAVPGKWQVNSSSSALASVASSEDGKFYSTINLTLNKDMKAGTTAKVISNMQEGSYSSLQGWQSRNVEAAPQEETPAPQPQPQPETPTTSGPEIVNDLAGKASTPADVTVKAPAGSTVKLYNKDGVVIGEAVANDQGVATIHPTNSLPEGEITATSTPAGGTESAKSAPITVTKTPTPIENAEKTEGPYKLQMLTNATKVTLYRGDKLSLTGAAAGTALRFFGITAETANNVAGVIPSGGLATNGSKAIGQSDAKAEGTVSWKQPLGDTRITFRVTGSPNPTSNQKVSIDRHITVTVLEVTKKYDPVAGTQVDIANPNKVSEDEKNKIIDSVKTANPNLPAESQYSVDEKGNLTITYPDGSTDKIAAAYLVHPTNPARENVAPTVEIPYSNKDTKEVYVYAGEANSFDIKFKDDSGKIASATVKQGGNRAFDPVAGEENTINTQYGFKANVINAETPATADAPAVITYSGTPAATDGLKQSDYDAATKGDKAPGMALGWRYATATDTDGAFIENKAVGSLTDPGAFRVMLKPQTQKYDITTPTEKVTVANPSNVTNDELAKIKEKVQLEYSNTNDDANLADKKGKPVADKDGKIQSIEKDADGNLVVTYKDGSQDKKPLSEFVNVAPTVELPYSNQAKKEIYVYTGENTDLTFKASDNTAVKDMYVRGPGGIGTDNTAGYGFTTGKIENSAVTHGDGTVSGATATLKMTGVTTLKAPNHWTSFVVANDNDNAPSATDFRALDQNPNATQTPGYVHFIVKSQTDKYDIATPADKVEVADPTNVTKDDLAKIEKKLKLEYNKDNDDANIAKNTPVDKDGKIKSVTNDGKGNLVVTYTDGSTDTKPLSEFVTKKPTTPAKDADGVKDPAKTPVKDPANLTDAEKAKVADEVKKANPTAKDVEVGKDGTTTVTFPDGSKAEIPAAKAVEKAKDATPAKDADGVKDPAKTPVKDPSNLTDAEKAKVADEVKKANPTAKDVEVGKDGTATVTFPDGSKAE
ncbi:hypothetical protein QM450_10375, partial [Streptococcus infantis]